MCASYTRLREKFVGEFPVIEHVFSYSCMLYTPHRHTATLDIAATAAAVHVYTAYRVETVFVRPSMENRSTKWPADLTVVGRWRKLPGRAQSFAMTA